jgi:hypothetical protein
MKKINTDVVFVQNRHNVSAFWHYTSDHTAILALTTQRPTINQHFVDLLGLDFGHKVRVSKLVSGLAGRRALKEIKEPNKRSAKNEPDYYVSCEIIHITVLSIFPIFRANGLPAHKLRGKSYARGCGWCPCP